MKILITCPPMLKRIDHYRDRFNEINAEIYCPEVKQTLSEEELIELVPQFDAWIIGDDPATRRVFEAGKAGKLKKAVKWGVGVDNVDFAACADLGIPIKNTPNMFGEEVSDVAMGYLLCLARKLHRIDMANRMFEWIKPCGNSLVDKKVCLVGFGDIGRCLARKLLAFRMNVWVSDPMFNKVDGRISANIDVDIEDCLHSVNMATLSECMNNADYVIVTCALNKHTHHLINKENLLKCNSGVRLINVARGPIIDQSAVCELLDTDHIDAVAFDVFEVEPLAPDNPLRNHKNNMFGSHNGSNTAEAVDRVSFKVIDILLDL